jgi:hypothetical protein
MGETRYEQYGTLDVESILEVLSRKSTEGSSQNDFYYLQNLLVARVAISLRDALIENARATEASAKLLQQSAEAGAKLVQEATTRSAKLLLDGMDGFSHVFEQSSRELQVANAQSATLSRRLNVFTLVLAIATVLMVAVGCWQAWEGMRQANVAEQALQQAVKPQAAPIQQNAVPANK